MFSWQNLEVCLKWKNDLAIFEWNQKPDSYEMSNVFCCCCCCFFLGGRDFVFSKYHIDSDFHLFQLILLEISFVELDFCHLFQVKNRILDWNHHQNNFFIRSSISFSIFCKIEKVFNYSDILITICVLINIDYYKIILIYFSCNHWDLSIFIALLIN